MEHTKSELVYTTRGTQVKNNLYVDSTNYTLNIGNMADPDPASMVLDDNAYLYREGNHRGININGPFYNLTVGTSEADLVHFQKTSGQETNGRRIVEGTGGLFVDRPGRDFRLVVPLSTWEAG